ncbi:hypothetical protein PG985_007878 [Apiospora marii]|uniref:uncharacterized protein n=1 Tax=Apiospora marii TaxID=335849 RepID=UPI00312CF5FE
MAPPRDVLPPVTARRRKNVCTEITLGCLPSCRSGNHWDRTASDGDGEVSVSPTHLRRSTKPHTCTRTSLLAGMA